MKFRKPAAVGNVWPMVFAVFLLWSGNLHSEINCAQSPDGCCCAQHIGNIDCSSDNEVDIADLQVLINHLYLTFEALPSPEQANLDRDPQGNVDIGDLTALVHHLFISFQPLPGCPGPINHPPNTTLGGAPGYLTEYVINPRAQQGGGGIPAQWSAEDRLDHPYDPSTLKCEWRLYGPYDSATYQYVTTHFVRSLFTSFDGLVLPRGNGTKFLVCDTIPTDSGPLIDCDSINIDTQPNNTGSYGWVGDGLMIGDPLFAGDGRYNRIAASSEIHGERWTSAGADTLYDVFTDFPNDTTGKWWFIFWARARDVDDSTLVDPTPPIRPLIVYDAQFENDVIVIDINVAYSVNGENRTLARNYWQRAVNAWSPTASYRFYSPDSPSGSVLPIELIMSHKVVILYGDDVLTTILSAVSVREKFFLAMRAGTSVWLTSRASLVGGEAVPPTVKSFASTTPTGIQYYFGATNYYYSGWEWWQVYPAVPQRIEDFEAARSTTLPGWPDLVVDTALLHSRYAWNYDWVPTVACPPEVNSIDPVPEAEVLYTYDSKYDGAHPYVSAPFDFHGRPVGYRLDRDDFRVVVFNFTPLFMKDDSVLQTTVDSVLNWLVVPFAPTAPHSASERRGHE